MLSTKRTLHSLLLKFAVLVLVSLVISGCGFQLKQSAAIPASFGPASISGTDKHSTLYKAIKNVLKQSGISLTETAARHKIIINQVTNDRRVLSVRTTGKASEYDLTKTLIFSVIDSLGNIIIDAHKLTTNRSYTVTNTDVLGSGLEEDDLKIRMERDLVDRMFRVIAAKM